jgi:hypothetical protein
VVSWGVACVGAADRYLAMLAAASGRLAEAERGFEAALALEQSVLAARWRLGRAFPTRAHSWAWEIRRMVAAPHSSSTPRLTRLTAWACGALCGTSRH